MKTIHSNVHDLNSFFKNVQIQLGGELKEKGKEYIFEIDSKMGNGIIRSIKLGEGISFFEFDMTLKEDFVLSLDTSVNTHVNFAYCSKGKLSHRFSNSDEKRTIETFQTGILSNVKSATNTLFFYKDIHIQSSIISVRTVSKNTNPHKINSQLRELFSTNKTEDFIHLGSFNLKIADYITQLKTIKQEGVVRSLLIKGLVNIILALEIEQHKNGLATSELSKSTLSKTELINIKELMDFVKNYPDLDHKLDILTQKVGLSASKIQEGFKLISGLTVCEYTRYVRLTKAEDLISNSDLNISEIVYSLGFTSRSYFSKIFKERYNCAPSHYKKKIKLAVSA